MKNALIRCIICTIALFIVKADKLYAVPGTFLNIPDLSNVDGYIYKISESDERLYIHFAEDGVPGEGGMCCNKTVQEARSNYPEKNLVYLPQATKNDINSGEIPKLKGVDGLIQVVSDTDNRLRIIFTKDGEPSGGGMCCNETIYAARQAYPNKNLIYLGERRSFNSKFSINLNDIDGYIVKLDDGRYQRFGAKNGQPVWGFSYCCPESLDEHVNSDKNYIYLPNVTSEEIRDYLEKNVPKPSRD